MRPEKHRRVVFQGAAHRLDLRLVVVDPGIESPAEDGPAEVGDQVDREPAPSGGQLVEHLLGLLRAGPGNPSHPLHEARGRHQLVGDQPRRLVFRSEQTQFDPLDRQVRSAQDELGEVTRAVPDGVFLPQLTQFGDLGRLAGDDTSPGPVLLEDRALQHLWRTVGVATGQQARQLHPGGQPARYPEHPYRDDGAITGALEGVGQLVDHLRRSVAVREPQHLDPGVGMGATLRPQPVVEQIGLGSG